MNRLLYRSDKTDELPTRVEILFMNVKYLSIGTRLRGPQIEHLGPLVQREDAPPWSFDYPGDLDVISVRTRMGDGVVVAGSVSWDETDANPYDPSSYFMMD